MRQNRICPKCNGRTFFAVAEAKMGDGRSINGTIELALAAEYVQADEGSFFRSGQARIEARIDAWICASCGYAELYTRDLTTLAKLVECGAAGVTFVDARPGTEGAFR